MKSGRTDEWLLRERERERGREWMTVGTSTVKYLGARDNMGSYLEDTRSKDRSTAEGEYG